MKITIIKCDICDAILGKRNQVGRYVEGYEDIPMQIIGEKDEKHPTLKEMIIDICDKCMGTRTEGQSIFYNEDLVNNKFYFKTKL